MPRLQADADADRWVAVTGSLGFRGRRHRRTAIRALLAQAGTAMGVPAQPGGGVMAWAMSQAVPFLMRRADGRVLAWVWKADPEVVAAIAQVQELTAQLRTARAMMPMEYDDTQRFRGTYLGDGEKLEMPFPPNDRPPFVSYTWDTGTHLVTVSALCFDKTRFGTIVGAVDDLARSIRLVDDLPLGESANVLRIDPA